MIHKVNRPASLSLVPATKHTENDPGGSSGSGLLYDGPPQHESPPQKSPNSEAEEAPAKTVKLALVMSVEQVGMTEVVKDFYVNKQDHETPAVNRVGLSARYSADASPAKGLLLNRKV